MIQKSIARAIMLACAGLCVGVSVAADISPLGLWVLDSTGAKAGEFPLPETGNNITAAYFSGDPARSPIPVEFNKDASVVQLLVPDGRDGGIVLEVADGTRQFPDGRIVLSALDASVTGETAKLESHPGNHRVGFWTDLDDRVSWSYKASRPGMYDVELCYSLAGKGGSEVELTFGDDKTTGELSPTGSWYRYSTARAGRIYIPKAGELTIAVRGLAKSGAALMNLKAVTLKPAPEGEPVRQAADGVVEMDASAATVHSTLMQYERKSSKLCLGYWANPDDWASWDFEIREPGKFRVELTQGCGRGHGGSEVEVLVAGETLGFTVEDTGGFQNWRVRELGEVEFGSAGSHRLEVRPRTKKGVAVMDVRRIRLVPAGS